jgi:hypothetical protein
VVLFLAGSVLVLGTLRSAVRSFVLPRTARDLLTTFHFGLLRIVFQAYTRRSRSYADRDQAMALYAPVALITLPVLWLGLVMLGYAAMYWALGVEPLELAVRLSGSSLLTLGYASVDSFGITLITFTEAVIGLILIALLIAYLPAMYTDFTHRETVVTMLEVRAGSPPSPVEMLLRYQRIHGLDRLGEMWPIWEAWFAEVEETHTSLSALVFFRSPDPQHSWITASGTVLDAASLVLSSVDRPTDPEAALCLRAGYLALRHISDFFRIPYDPNPAPTDPISVTRAEFEEALNDLERGGIHLKPDRDQAWRDFAGWRVNYDVSLLELADLTMAPYAPWISDRGSPIAHLRGRAVSGLLGRQRYRTGSGRNDAQ